MDRVEALAVLGLAADADGESIRHTFRRLIAEAHPDVAGPSGTSRAARLNVAYAVLRTAPAGPGPAPSPSPSATPRVPGGAGPVTLIDAGSSDERTLLVDAPGPETFQALEEAAASVGYVSYIDRHLHLLEIVVRFEGGPSCSVVMTLQGRATHTEVFVTMESIEAAPTPSSSPVVDALATALDEVLDGER